MNNPFFSTIIPVYNRRELVVPAIESALHQTFADQEIIVVDDGSTDGTAEVVRDHYGDRIVLLSQPNAGPGPARNTAIAAARGKYVAFLDSDDLWFPWTLALHYQAIERYSPALVSGAAVSTEEMGTMLQRGFIEPEMTRYDDLYSAFADSFAISGTPSIAVRSDELRRVGGFANRSFNAEDLDLWMRLGSSGGFVRITQPPTFALRQHAGCTSANRRRTAEGISFLLKQERDDRYPGGEARRSVRIISLTRFQRPASIDCVNDGAVREGIRLYREAIGWNLRLGRLRYLLAFPLIAGMAMLKRVFRGPENS